MVAGCELLSNLYQTHSIHICSVEKSMRVQVVNCFQTCIKLIAYTFRRRTDSARVRCELLSNLYQTHSIHIVDDVRVRAVVL